MSRRPYIELSIEQIDKVLLRGKKHKKFAVKLLGDITDLKTRMTTTDVKAELEILEKENARWEDEYNRRKAELINFKDRSEKRLSELHVLLKGLEFDEEMQHIILQDSELQGIALEDFKKESTVNIVVNRFKTLRRRALNRLSYRKRVEESK